MIVIVEGLYPEPEYVTVTFCETTMGVTEGEGAGDTPGDNGGVGEGASVVEIGVVKGDRAGDPESSDEGEVDSRDSLIPPENKKTATLTRTITIMTKSISFFIPYKVADSQLYT